MPGSYFPKPAGIACTWRSGKFKNVTINISHPLRSWHNFASTSNLALSLGLLLSWCRYGVSCNSRDPTTFARSSFWDTSKYIVLINMAYIVIWARFIIRTSNHVEVLLYCCSSCHSYEMASYLWIDIITITTVCTGSRLICAEWTNTVAKQPFLEPHPRLWGQTSWI